MLREHFSCDENATRLGTSAGAVMVFTSMRNAVTDICERLNGLEGAKITARCDFVTNVVSTTASAAAPPPPLLLLGGGGAVVLSLP